MRDKLHNWAVKHLAAISFVLVLFLLAVGAGLSVAHANELPEGLEGKHIEIPVVCGDTRDLYRALTQDHGETPVVIAFSEKQVAVVWFTSPDKTTMSFVIDTPSGESCMLYSTRCFEGDCFMTPSEAQEQAEEIVNDSPKVSL